MSNTTQRPQPETNATKTLLSAMIARFDGGDLQGAEACYRQAKKQGATDDQIAAAWDLSKTLGR